MNQEPTGTAYERARRHGEATLRSGLLDVAGDLLANQGADALTMRRVADAAGCSTAVLYRMFAGKQGLLAGLYREGFARLHQRLAQVEAGDPVARLTALAGAYREHARADPAYYAVMFSRPVPEFQPSPEDIAHADESFQVLVDGVAAAQGAGAVGGDDPRAVARVLWAAVHGAVSLELAGYLRGAEAERTFTTLAAAAIAHAT